MPQIDVLFMDDVKKQLSVNVIAILYDLIIDELIYPIVMQNIEDPDKEHITALISPIISCCSMQGRNNDWQWYASHSQQSCYDDVQCSIKQKESDLPCSSDQTYLFQGSCGAYGLL